MSYIVLFQLFSHLFQQRARAIFHTATLHYLKKRFNRYLLKFLSSQTTYGHIKAFFSAPAIDGSILPPSVSSERGIERSPSSSSITAGRAGNTQSTEIRQEPLEPTNKSAGFEFGGSGVGKNHNRKSHGSVLLGWIFCLEMGVAPPWVQGFL